MTRLVASEPLTLQTDRDGVANGLFHHCRVLVDRKV